MFVIPAIDLLGGVCVRLTEGDYGTSKMYDVDPVAVALRFQEQGSRWLHVVDLDGAKAGRPMNQEVISRIAKATSMKVQVGGGIRTVPDVRAVLAAGAARVVMGTRLTQDMELAEALFNDFGDRLVAGIDTKNGMVAIQGWTETSALRGVDFARHLQELGCERVVFTDVARDGTLLGPNLVATREMVEETAMKIVASGGVSNIQDVRDLVQTGAEAVIVVKALYEGRFSLADVAQIGP